MPYKCSLGRRPYKITLRLSPELYVTLCEIAVERKEPLAMLIRRVLSGWPAVPKLYFKERALEMVFRLGEMLAKMAAENGVREITVGRGELRSLLNKGGGRSKDLISMALRRFVIADSIQSSGWRMEIVDRRKPIIHLKLVNHDG